MGGGSKLSGWQGVELSFRPLYGDRDISGELLYS